MADFTVLPLFSSPVFVTRIDEDLDPFFARIRQDYDFVARKGEDDGASLITTRTDLLDDHPSIAAVLLAYFGLYKDRVLRFERTDFAITTSWATLSPKNAASQFHAHANCVFSGVVYADGEPGSGELEFEDVNLIPSNFLLSDPEEWNLLNSKTWSIAPAKNRLVFFPSYLRHRISRHQAESPRYSVAFNLMPVGKFGRGDSSVTLRTR